jgi:hypothetical protein
MQLRTAFWRPVEAPYRLTVSMDSGLANEGLYAYESLAMSI